MLEIIEFFISLIVLLARGLGALASSFINGVQFLLSTLTTIPLFILDLFDELPIFFQVGLSGLVGLVFLVIFLKFASLVFVSSK